MQCDNNQGLRWNVYVQAPTLLSAATAWQGYKTAATAPVTVTPVTPAAETAAVAPVPAASTAATKAAAVSRAKTASSGSSSTSGFAVDTSALTQQVRLPLLFRSFTCDSFTVAIIR